MKHEQIIAATVYRYEDDMQKDFYAWAITKYPQLYGLLFAVPNGGKRNAREAKKLKDMGATAGVPDFICLHDNKITAIELKLPKRIPSDTQEKIHALWWEHNIPVYIIRTFPEWKAVIERIVNY